MDEIIFDITGMTREQAIKEAMRLFHFDRCYAEFYVAIELGEIDGDIVLIGGEDTEDSAYTYDSD